MKHPKTPEIQECQAFRGARLRGDIVARPAIAAVALLLATFLTACAARRPDPPTVLATLAEPAGIGRWDVVAVRRDGPEVLRWRSNGPRDDAPYDLCSVGKLFTMAIVADMDASGRMPPDTDVEELLGRPLRDPRLGDESIRVRHLLTHTSGLSAVGGELVQRTPAGLRYEYSNEAWSILVDVAEVFSEQSFAELLRARIAPIPGLSVTESGGLPRGAGGIAATPDAAAAWARSVVEGAWLADAQSRTLAMGLPNRTPPLAAGWRAVYDQDGSVHRFAQSGSTPRSGAEFAWYPREGAAILVLADGRYDAEFFREARRAAERRLGIAEPGRRRLPDVPTASLAGEWTAPATGGRLAIARTGRNRLELVFGDGVAAMRRRGPRTFLPSELAGDPLGRSLAAEGQAELEALVGDDGAVAGLWWRGAFWRQAGAPAIEAKLRSN